jgi:hypothetical protein
MERYPLDFIQQHKTRCYHELREYGGINSIYRKFLKVYTTLLQELYTIISVHILGQVEFKIKLPGAHGRRQPALFISECKSQLDEIKKVHITSQCLVQIILGSLKISQRSSDNAGELSIHSHVRIVLHNLGNILHFLLQVLSPYILDDVLAVFI